MNERFTNGLLNILTPRLVELGAIRIGKKSDQKRTSKSGGEWQATERLNHFIITTMERDANDQLIQDKFIMDDLKSQGFADPDGHLRQIPVALMSDDLTDIMQTSYCWYSGSQIAARSDGVTLTKFIDTKTKERLEQPEEMEWKPEFAKATDSKGNRVFKPHTTFNCVICGSAARFGGVYRFRTSSIITGSQLLGSLMMLKGMTGGVLAGIPARLVVRPMRVSPGGKPTTVYVVHCEMRGKDMQEVQRMAVDLARFKLDHKQQMEEIRSKMTLLLSGPGYNESPVEQADLQDEFHPEENEHDEPGEYIEEDEPTDFPTDEPTVIEVQSDAMPNV